MRVECEVFDVELEGDSGRNVPAVVAACIRCGHAAQAFGVSGTSVKRCLVMLREGCPLGEENLYVVDK